MNLQNYWAHYADADVLEDALSLYVLEILGLRHQTRFLKVADPGDLQVAVAVAVGGSGFDVHDNYGWLLQSHCQPHIVHSRGGQLQVDPNWCL